MSKIFNPSEIYIDSREISNQLEDIGINEAYLIIRKFLPEILFPSHVFPKDRALLSDFKKFILSNDYKQLCVFFNEKRIKTKINCQNSRVKALNIKGIINLTDIQQLLLIQNNNCFYCGSPLGSTKQWHIDHYIPLCKGGNNYIENIRICCAFCNSSKCGLMPKEFKNKIFRKHGKIIKIF